jgi:hypothetical protein
MSRPRDLSADGEPLVVVRLAPELSNRLAADRSALSAIAEGFADREPVLFVFAGGGPDHFDGAVAAATWLQRFPIAWFAVETPDIADSGHPYNLARRIASLEQLSRGRIAWVHGLDTAKERERDYVRVVQQLWRSWPLETLAADASAPHFADTDLIRRIGAVGAYEVAGPLNVPSSPQYLPVVVGPSRVPDRHHYVDLIPSGAGWVVPEDGTLRARVVAASSPAQLASIAATLPVGGGEQRTLRDRLSLTAPSIAELDGASARFPAGSTAEAS